MKRATKAKPLTSPPRATPRSKALTGEAFDALPDSEKERVYQEIDRASPGQLLAESRPLNARDRAVWRRIKRRLGRPKIGKGVKVVSVSLEKDLLRRADALAKRQGISRAKLISRGLEQQLGREDAA